MGSASFLEQITIMSYVPIIPRRYNVRLPLSTDSIFWARASYPPKKGTQMIAASPTALIRAAKTPITHSEDTDTHTYLAQKSQTCVDLAKLHFVSEGRNICTLFWKENVEDSISHVKISSILWTEWHSSPMGPWK